MDKSDYTVEDFVLDKEFQMWVLMPTNQSRLFWDNYLAQNPGKLAVIELAREMLLNMARFEHQILENDADELWEIIHQKTHDIVPEKQESTRIFLNSKAAIQQTKKSDLGGNVSLGLGNLFRIAAILVFSLSLALLAYRYSNPDQQELMASEVPEWVEYKVPKGIKSSLSLSDGSKITLNSGSTVRYIKNFEKDKREMFLQGEALFEVAKDSLRPFTVVSGELKTTALGTVFNVRAFDLSAIRIALLEGKVEVKKVEDSEKVILKPGETIKMTKAHPGLVKEKFNVDEVLAWTQKTIYFNYADANTAFQTIENWYGVNIQIHNKPKENLRVTGKYKDQTLKNVLEGLSYSMHFDFTIRGDQITINFR